MARRKEKKENSGLKKLVILLAILVIAFPAAAFSYIYFKLNAMHDATADENILNEMKKEIDTFIKQENQKK